MEKLESVWTHKTLNSEISNNSFSDLEELPRLPDEEETRSDEEEEFDENSLYVEPKAKFANKKTPFGSKVYNSFRKSQSNV